MGTVLVPLLTVVDMALHLYMWAFIIAAIVSWLIAFNVINTYNKAVYMITDFLYRITEPVLKPIRRFLPNLGGMDISPIVAIFAIYFIRLVLWEIRLGL